MKFEEIEKKVSNYRWLKEIAESYRKMIVLINREEDYFSIHSMEYSARGDVEKLNINCHRSIPPKYIRAGLSEALKGIEQEMEQISKELKEINIEV
ncbi:MAG: hypothetical protein IJ523_12260 [Succinivibrionaceae bacterium]|nr:hypothetical protein [Succinivibrionaceae bacterium]